MHFRRHRPALLFAAVVAMTGCRPPTGPQTAELPPLDVPVAVPLEREIIDYEEYPGKVMSVERVNVIARADGYLLKSASNPANS